MTSLGRINRAALTYLIDWNSPGTIFRRVLYGIGHVQQ
jgi:hypothetical protein